MFTYDEETRYCWINGASLESERKFELVGMVIGLALYNGVILGASFPQLMYKKLLDENIDLEDFKEAFPVCILLLIFKERVFFFFLLLPLFPKLLFNLYSFMETHF